MSVSLFMRRFLLGFIGVFTAGGLLLLAFLGFLIGTEAGWHFLAHHAPQWALKAGLVLEASGPQGRIVATPTLAHLTVKTPALEVRMQGLALAVGGRSPWREGRLVVPLVSVERLDLYPSAPSAETEGTPLPESLQIPPLPALPLAVQLDGVKVDALCVHTPEAAPLCFEAVFLKAHTSPSKDLVLDILEAKTPWGPLMAKGHLATQPPFALDAEAGLQGVLNEETPFGFSVVAHGVWDALEVEAHGHLGLARAQAQLWVEALSKQAELRLEGRVSALNLAAVPGLKEGPDSRLSLAFSMNTGGARSLLDPVFSLSSEDSHLLGEALSLSVEGRLRFLWPEALQLEGLWGGSRLSGRLSAQVGPDTTRMSLSPELTLALNLTQEHAQRLNPSLGGLTLEATGTQAAHRLTLNAEWDEAPWALTLASSVSLEPLQGQGQVLHLSGGGPWPLRWVSGGPFAWKIGPQGASTDTLFTMADSRWTLGEAKLHIAGLEWAGTRARTQGRLTGLPVASTLAFAPEALALIAQSTLTLGADWDIDWAFQDPKAAAPRTARPSYARVKVLREDGDLILHPEEGAARPLALEGLHLAGDVTGHRLTLEAHAHSPQWGRLAFTLENQAAKTQKTWFWDENHPVSAQLRAEPVRLGPLLAWALPEGLEGWALDGRLQGVATLSGTAKAPLWEAQIEGEDLWVARPEEGLVLEQGRLMARADPRGLFLEQLHFQGPGEAAGHLQAEGQFLFAQEGTPEEGLVRVEMKALRVLSRPDRTLVLSGLGAFQMNPDAMTLGASIRADSGLFRLPKSAPPTLSDDICVIGETGTAHGCEAVPPAPASARPLRIDVAIDLGPALHIEALGLQSGLSGVLRLERDGVSPLRASGSLATQGGVFQGYGQHLALSQGFINFQGPLDNPGLNIRAVRPGLPVEVGLRILGTARQPRVGLFSDPRLPDLETLAWLVLGRPLDPNAGAMDMVLLVPMAQAIMTGEADPGLGLSTRLARGLGLDSLSLSGGDVTGPVRSSTVVGHTQAGETGAGYHLRLGKQLSHRLSVSVEQGFAGAESLLRLSYQLSRRLGVVVRAGAVGSSVDLHYGRRF